MNCIFLATKSTRSPTLKKVARVNPHLTSGCGDLLTANGENMEQW